MRRDNVTHLQTVSDGNGTTKTVVVGILRNGCDVRQYIVRRLSAAALGVFERDVDTALRRGEDPELTIAAWSELEGE